ncbi:MAG: CBS domain-containing protein [Gammaproteobacteria bacterium]
MSIENICNHDVVMLPPGASIQEAAQLMKEKNVGCVVVVKDVLSDKSPIGIITDRDIAIKLTADDVDAEQVTVYDVMSREIVLIFKNDSVKKAIIAMQAKGVRRAPVIDENHKVCGIISLDDLFVLLIEELDFLKDLIQKQIQRGKK